jgi:hypothetical protein
MNRSIKKVVLMLCLFSIFIASIPSAIAEGNNTNQTNATVTPTVTVTANPTPTITATVAPTAVGEKKFRVGPTVRLRPLNSNIDKDKDGIVEIFLNNPSLNDISLEVDMSVSVPTGIYIYGEDGGMSGGAGTVVGHFSVPPGSSRTITLHIKATEIGNFPVHFGGMYWPEGDKDKWNPISLDNSFKATKPSDDIPTPTPTPGPEPKPYELPYTWIILAAVVLGGIAIVFALGRKPPKTEVNIEQ